MKDILKAIVDLIAFCLYWNSHTKNIQRLKKTREEEKEEE